MSGDGFAAKRRSEKATNVPDERSQRTLLDELKSQAGSMAGMAGMFIVTILLAMKIQILNKKKCVLREILGIFHLD